jgi:hypothetical protein
LSRSTAMSREVCRFRSAAAETIDVVHRVGRKIVDDGGRGPRAAVTKRRSMP